MRGSSDKRLPALSNCYCHSDFKTSPFFIRKGMVKIYFRFTLAGSTEPPEPPLDPPQPIASRSIQFINLVKYRYRIIIRSII